MILAKASIAIVAIGRFPEIVFYGSQKDWPNAIPSAFVLLLFSVGIVTIARTARSSPTPWLPIAVGLFWLAGAGMMGDRPLELVGWSLPGSELTVLALYLGAAALLWAEWRYRPAFCILLLAGVAWPWADWVVGPPAIQAIGVLGSGALAVAAVESVTRYKPTRSTHAL